MRNAEHIFVLQRGQSSWKRMGISVQVAYPEFALLMKSGETLNIISDFVDFL